MDARDWVVTLYRLFLLNICAFVAFNIFFAHPIARASVTTPSITVYTAHKIITVDPAKPVASAVAVKDGKILSVGSLTDMKKWLKPGSYRIDNQFYDNFITPGLIDSHTHLTLLVLFLEHPYIGYHDTTGFDNRTLRGLKSRAAVFAALNKFEKDIGHPDDTLFAWGYDPIYFENKPLTAAELDKISATRPIFILSASGHTGYANSVLLKKCRINAHSQTPGIEKDDSGEPTGVLKDDEAMMLVFNNVANEIITQEEIRNGLENTANLANHVGLTTISDMNFGGPYKKIFMRELKRASQDPFFPVRIVIVQNGDELSAMEEKEPGSGITYLQNLKKYETDKLYFSGIKYILDGAIEDFSADLKWPGYFNETKGQPITADKEELKKAALPFWKAGIPIHIHVNGNKATDDALDILEYLQNTAPRRDSIFILEHNQMSSEEQFVRAKRLGAYTNLFPSQIYFLGEEHLTITLGPDRAAAMNNTAEAKKAGIRYAIHSNAPETPINPLISIWAAVNRTTVTGKVLGKKNKITPFEALQAMTINAAYMHNLQDKIGSIEVGKKADFTVLKYDPLSVRPYTIKDIPVIATIVDGIVYPVRERSRY